MSNYSAVNGGTCCLALAMTITRCQSSCCRRCLPAPQVLSASKTTFHNPFFEGHAIDPKHWLAFVGDSVGDAEIEAQYYRASQVGVVAGDGLRLNATSQGAGAGLTSLAQ